MDAATQRVGFDVYVPKGLGDYLGIYVAPNPVGQGAAAFVFDSPDFGRIQVIESLPDVPDVDQRLKVYEDRVARNGEPNRWTASSIETIREGVPAIIGTSEFYSATIEWVDGQLQYYVIGPSLTSGESVKIANAL